MKRVISTDKAPAAIGAYSQAVKTEELIFTSGQLPITADGELLDDASVTEQTDQCLKNVQAILEEEGKAMENVVKTTVFLSDIDDFDEFNETYSEFFADEPPARSAIEVGRVPKGAAIEIEAIAVASEQA
ncbi:Rid family detoxifying hydrolase [Natronococcus occultus]|uniref:Endoribonuclease L-PSP, putative n=1 Tax=Natronococcus occultus SP4 TaxID=694430 RepID=L0K429_9EURY|nr:Rid family detoxifying hydrolase [Natronococcus occultus]AGB38853.1 endoribonuclease L-PSP, putative [Natronococcus occultus SP4]